MMGKVRKILAAAMLYLLVVMAAAAPVTVQAADMKLNQASLTLNVKESRKLKVIGVKKGKVAWKSSNPKVASVSAKGRVKAKKEGTAVITATVKSKKLSCKVTVKKSGDLKEMAKVNAKAYKRQIAEIVRYTNQYRTAQGLRKLKLDETLTQAACHRSAEMAKANILSHERPDGSTPWDLMKQYGISYNSAGENIAYTGGYGIASEKVTQMWYESPGHRANMLGAGYGEIGIGIAVSDNGLVYYTQLFTN